MDVIRHDIQPDGTVVPIHRILAFEVRCAPSSAPYLGIDRHEYVISQMLETERGRFICERALLLHTAQRYFDYQKFEEVIYVSADVSSSVLTELLLKYDK